MDTIELSTMVALGLYVIWVAPVVLEAQMAHPSIGLYRWTWKERSPYDLDVEADRTHTFRCY